METDLSNNQVDASINNTTTMMETIDLFTHMLDDVTNEEATTPPVIRQPFGLRRRNIRQSPIHNIFNRSTNIPFSFPRDISNNIGTSTTRTPPHVNTIIRNIIDNSNNSMEESGEFDSYIRFIEDILQLPSLSTEFPSGLPSRNHIRELLQETLHEKPKFKQVLSAEGEANIKSIVYNPEIHVNVTCCPITQVDFSANDTISQLPCGHLFDSNAILKWLKDEKAECPICRFKMKSHEKKLEPKQSGPIDISSNRTPDQNIRFRHPFGPRRPRSSNYYNFRRLMMTRQSYEEEDDLQTALLASLEEQYMPNTSNPSDSDSDID